MRGRRLLRRLVESSRRQPSRDQTTGLVPLHDALEALPRSDAPGASPAYRTAGSGAIPPHVRVRSVVAVRSLATRETERSDRARSTLPVGRIEAHNEPRVTKEPRGLSARTIDLRR